MMYGLKPFNGAEMRNYLDIISEAPFTANPKGVPIKTGQPSEPEQDFGTQVINKGFPMVAKGMTDLAPDMEKTLQNFTPGSEYYQKNVANNPELVKRAAEVTSQVQPGDFTKSVTDTSQKLNKVLNTPQKDLGRSATSPEYDAVADKVGLPPVQEEMRGYLDMLEADDVTGHGQISTKDIGGGTKVSFDPATGGKTVSGAEGTTSYDVKGQKTAQASPNIGGFQKSTNYQTGEKTTTGQVGPVSLSSTQRPDQSTVQTASVPLGHNVQATASRGIGFGGAGKDVQQGGNQITSITARTAKNPEGVTSSFTGMPTAQDLEKAIPDDWAASGNEFSDPDAVNEDEELPGTKGDWRHGGHSVKYDPSSNTVHVKGKGGEAKHAFGKHPSHDNYRKRVQQIIDKLENDLTESDRMRDFIKLIS